MTPTVTVVMPAYNAEAFIGEAIESVLAQTYADWQLVVVDDGSTDRTSQVFATYDDPRLRLVTIEHSGLPAVARNRGLLTSESPFVAFLDADDLWRPHKLSEQLALLDSQPEVGLVHTDFEQLRDGMLEPFLPPPGLTASGPQFERLAVGNYIANSSVLLRRELLTRYGFFDEDLRLRGTEDFELWMRLSPHTKFAYVDEPLLLYRLHAANLGQGEQMGLGYLTTMEKMERLHPDLVAGLGVPYWRMLGFYRVYFGLKGRGRRELLRVLRRHPRDEFAWRWLVRSFLPADFLRAHGGVRPWAAGHMHRRFRERRRRSGRS
jgi:glycosyltransferase involved in cell wall biosynthesis